MKYLILLSFLFSFSANALKNNIVNGDEVSSDSIIAKTTVLITGKYTRFSYTCTGSVIQSDIIITAAHCLGPYAAADLTVFFGVNKNKPGLTYKVKKRIQHSNYDANKLLDRNDLALLLLEKPIPMGYSVADIPPQDYQMSSSQKVILAGYGMNVPVAPPNGNGGLGVLRMAEQNIIEPKYGQDEILINIKNKGTCGGDSGGPSFVVEQNKLYLVGAASRLTDKDIIPGSKPIQYQCTEEIVYTNLINYQEWIKESVKQLNQMN